MNGRTKAGQVQVAGLHARWPKRYADKWEAFNGRLLSGCFVGRRSLTRPGLLAWRLSEILARSGSAGSRSGGSPAMLRLLLASRRQQAADKQHHTFGHDLPLLRYYTSRERKR